MMIWLKPLLHAVAHQYMLICCIRARQSSNDASVVALRAGSRPEGQRPQRRWATLLGQKRAEGALSGGCASPLRRLL